MSQDAPMRRAARPPIGLRLGLLPGLLLPGILGGTASAARSAPPSQESASTVPDQVHSRHRRDGSVVITTGTVKRDDLDQVEVHDGKVDVKLDSDLVLRIVFGDAPPTFQDAQTFFERGDWANAASRFRLAAGDAGARPVVQAVARLRAGRSLMEWGAREPARFAEAVEELQRFVTDHPRHRLVPEARMLLARGKLLSGDAAGATSLYRELFALGRDGKAPQGHDLVECMRAGLHGARAALLQRPADTLAARELYDATHQAASAAGAGAPAGSRAARDLLEIADDASLGEGFVQLSSGNARQALAFFQGRASGLARDSSSALRYGCLLGLGEALLREGKPREAQIELARVSAIEPSDRDRVARALLLLAECAQILGDPSAREWGRTWLSTLSEQFGDTPSAHRARELLKTF